MMRRLSVLLAVVASGCIPSERTGPPVAAPAPRASPAPPPLAADWRDWPQTPGDWRWSREVGGSSARFGMAGAAARLTLRCEPGRRAVTIAVPGAAAGALTVRTTSTQRTLATAASPEGAAVTLAATDPLLDAMAFSRGRFVVEAAGTPPLVLPAWAEVGRIVQDCRG